MQGAEGRMRKRWSPIIKSEVEAAIRKMNKDYKAAGPDDIKVEQIKILEEFRIKEVLNEEVLNEIYDSGSGRIPKVLNLSS